MKIEKFIKDKNNKYKVIIDSEEYKLYDDTILKYNLLNKEEIDNKLLDEVLSFNDSLKAYYESIKYITLRLRSKKEIREYLKKKEISDNIINDTIKKLEENNFINEEIYTKSYINDSINLKTEGPYKIKSSLLKLGIKEELIDEYLDKISNDVWSDKIDTYVSKKIKGNSKYSTYMLRSKILLNLTNLGFNKEDVLSILQKYDIIDKDIYLKEKEKAYKELSKKYEGYELDQKVKMRLYRKGFKGDGYYEE